MDRRTRTPNGARRNRYPSEILEDVDIKITLGTGSNGTTSDARARSDEAAREYMRLRQELSDDMDEGAEMIRTTMGGGDSADDLVNASSAALGGSESRSAPGGDEGAAGQFGNVEYGDEELTPEEEAEKQYWDELERASREIGALTPLSSSAGLVENSFDRYAPPVPERRGLDPSYSVQSQITTQPRNVNLLGQPGKDRIQDQTVAYWRMGNETRGFVQQMLAQAGYADSVPMGGWGSQRSLADRDYQKAWQDAIDDAALAQVPLMEHLRTMGEGSTNFEDIMSGPDGPPPPKRPTMQLTSEVDLRRMLNEQARDTIGRRLTKDEEAVMKKMMGAVRGTEAAEQNALFDQQLAGGGSVDRTTTGGLVEEQLRTNFDEERQKYGVMGAFASMVNMARRPGGM